MRYLNSIIFILILFSSFAYTAGAQALLQTGTEAPGFSLKDIEGREVGLLQFSQKKAVVLLFWSTWSRNSERALKRFEEFYKKHGERVQVIGINADNQTISPEDVEKIKKLAGELGITFPVLLDRELNAFHAYGVMALPSTTVIAEGKIAYELPGLPLVKTEDMFDYLLTLAGESPRKKAEPQYKPRHDAIADTNLGRGFVKKKLNDMAYPFFRKAMEKDPKYMLPYVELAKLCETDGNTAEAEGILRKALSVEPENVVIMSELGYLLSKTGKVKEALGILDKAAKMNSYTPSHYYLAYALGKDGRMKEALEAFESAQALNPFEPMIYLLRGEVYERNKTLKEASSDYRKALELTLKIKD